MNSLIIKPGLPGGMMGSLMTDLEARLVKLNAWLEKRGKKPMDSDALLIKLFDEVAHIWPKMGYPPLVTPFSQYVKNTALMNVLQIIKGKERWSLIDDNTWDMMLGRAGRLPGKLDPELVALAQSQNREFFTEDPQDLYKDDLETFRKEMEANNWELGEDEEELFELAMHPAQYRNYKSGKAKTDFLADLEKKRAAKATPKAAPAAAGGNGQAATMPSQPKTLKLEVNGEPFVVKVSYGEEDGGSASVDPQSQAYANTVAPPPSTEGDASGSEVLAPLEGTFYLTKEPQEKPKQIGQPIKKGDLIGYIEAMKSYNAIAAEEDGIISWLAESGSSIDEDDVIAKVK